MPKNSSTRAQKARRLQALRGGAYTDALQHLDRSGTPAGPMRADVWLGEIMASLAKRGWPATPFDMDFGRYLAFSGPVALDAGRDVDDPEAQADGADPDDPRWATAPLYLGVLAPFDASVDDLSAGARADQESPEQIAVRIDSELADARLRLVQAAEPESTTPCPICRDRYPEHHLLATSSEGVPVCGACAWDADHRWRADLPYLAVQLDRLLDEDLAAPAGWAAVAAVLALTCGPNLGRRLERQLNERGGWPVVSSRWSQPLDQSWFWLPPPQERHPAFEDLGAGATLAAVTTALQRHDPALPRRARQICRDADVRWRPALWHAAVAYGVAFSTQAAERDRHRKPVHVVDSTGDGLSNLRAPFAVTGDARNVEGGLEVLLEHLLFPLLLGHGMRDQPREDRRLYGAGPDDDRPGRSRSDPHLRAAVDRTNQIAVVLGRVPGLSDAQVIWDGSARPPADGPPLGATRSVNAVVNELRQQARIEIAGQMFDDAGPTAMSADQAWERAGWWIPADTAAHAVRQADDFLAGGPQVRVLWAGSAGQLTEPMWIDVRVSEVHDHSTGPQDMPWLRVFDGESLFGMRLSDIALLRRAEPAAPTDVPGVEACAYSIDPSADEAWRLVGHNIHQLAHDHPRSWAALDHLASKSRERLWTIPTEHGQDVTVQMWVRLADTEVECTDPACQARSEYLTASRPGEEGRAVPGALPEFAHNDGLAYFTFATHPHDDHSWATSKDPQTCTWMYTVLALYGGYMSINWMDFADPKAVTIGHSAWEIHDYSETELRRTTMTSGPDGITQTEDGDPAFAWPPLPPEVAAERERKAQAHHASDRP